MTPLTLIYLSIALLVTLYAYLDQRAHNLRQRPPVRVTWAGICILAGLIWPAVFLSLGLEWLEGRS